MSEASANCMEKCKAKYAQLTKPIVVGHNETADQAKARARAPLIDGLIKSKCCAESDRHRLEMMEPLGLVAELCGCECSGIFPHANTDLDEGDPDVLTPNLVPPKRLKANIAYEARL